VAQLIGRPAAAIVVTTPQQLSVADVRRSITFCRQAGLPVLGLVENMSGYSCPKCGDTTPLFKTGGGSNLALEMNVPFLGAIPIDPQIVEAGDSGTPFVDRFFQSPSALAFARLLPPILDALKTHIETKNENNSSKIITMKIAIPLSGGLLSEHFGHCEQFAIVEADLDAKKILTTNLVTPPPHEPGLLPKWLREQGVVTVIAGGIGQRALNIFAQNGIIVRAGFAAAPVDQIVNAFLQGELTGTPQGCAHHEHGEHHHEHSEHECGK
jgi:predicted Fe-Mo cluster-binding NifX family protein